MVESFLHEVEIQMGLLQRPHAPWMEPSQDSKRKSFTPQEAEGSGRDPK